MSHGKTFTNAPQVMFPCGHSFCLTCICNKNVCPTCNVDIVSVEQNDTMLKVIAMFQERKRKEEER